MNTSQQLEVTEENLFARASKLYREYKNPLRKTDSGSRSSCRKKTKVTEAEDKGRFHEACFALSIVSGHTEWHWVSKVQQAVDTH
jgi:hypothetical protein